MPVGTYNGVSHIRQTVTTAGTSVQLTSTSTPCHVVEIQAFETNTGRICVGDSTVDETIATRKGIIINAGDTYDYYINNADKIYLDSSVNGEGVACTVKSR